MSRPAPLDKPAATPKPRALRRVGRCQSRSERFAESQRRASGPQTMIARVAPGADGQGGAWSLSDEQQMVDTAGSTFSGTANYHSGGAVHARSGRYGTLQQRYYVRRLPRQGSGTVARRVTEDTRRVVAAGNAF